MVVWEHLDVSKAHVAYACVGVFSCIFSLVSLFVKERLYIGESTVAVIFGLIVGPHCLDWFDPIAWGNTDSITLEISRIVLCLQIFAVAVELPKKYMLKHWMSVTMLLVPVMTTGWLIIGLFVWILIPGLDFSSSLLISACITATDPILAQSVVSGKFAERVPGHLRNLLSAESGCNDGMAFPFIYLSLNLVIYPGNSREIMKDWLCITILYECIFGCILGIVIGYTGRRAIRYAEEKRIIDRESFLAFYVVLAMMCAGFGSILGVDDLLVSFAAGAAFAWDGWFAKKTEESKVSTVIDLLLNLAYFVYFGAIIPWQKFNDPSIGTHIWRLMILAVVVITLRRIPAVLVFKSMIPDIKSWREALFVGHFGPIGVGAIFAAILARAELEAHATGEETPLRELPAHGTTHWQLIACVWPIVCFLIVTSIIVHGSSVAVITLGRHLNTITLTKSFTTHTTNGNNRSSSWMQRLPGLDKSGRSFSLHRIDTLAPPEVLTRAGTVETSGIPVKPVGGMKRRQKKLSRKSKAKEMFRTASKRSDFEPIDSVALKEERMVRERQAKAAAFALSREDKLDYEEKDLEDEYQNEQDSKDDAYHSSQQSLNYNSNSTPSDFRHSIGMDDRSNYKNTPANTSNDERIQFPSVSGSSSNAYEEKLAESSPDYNDDQHPTIAYQEGNNLILENKQGEIVAQTMVCRPGKDLEDGSGGSSRSDLPAEKRHSLRKVVSPLFLKKSTLIQDERGAKYHAYKVNDTLIIENEDGEVLRRYKINRHDSGKSSTSVKKRSSSVVSKALSAVGLGRSSNSSVRSLPATEDVQNVAENPQKHIQPRKLTPVPSVHSDAPFEDDDEEFSELSDGYDYTANDVVHKGVNEEEETAIERVRRLTALGEYSAPRDDDDEEDVPHAVLQSIAGGNPNNDNRNVNTNTSTSKTRTALGLPFHK
ncbi:Nha1p Ecym_4231 [Eremothecium cymbalariae DBVPG|uniref:Na(+)/H(+) antiporter n=1 Tax=Eremothecium cymbalariae (strain CBS 270.75 / DBVPG 7215 / KCTC 17166 / NRRL Y-17582) TaxID=931890 RepID=G8JTE5_ERECY|nr:hypothetical protein Ecym_4231 [Eremothecium cymbalariae DBVPG\